ncbi:MAG: hypothetical protein M0C28_18260 [Candidatus Moduliflexus flocculans]|nr:hypothetical protein [Candidatus Moduliflexus flocculans]
MREALSAGQIPATGFVPRGFIDNNGADFSVTAGTYGIAADDSMYDEAVTLFAGSRRRTRHDRRPAAHGRLREEPISTTPARAISSSAK